MCIIKNIKRRVTKMADTEKDTLRKRIESIKARNKKMITLGAVGVMTLFGGEGQATAVADKDSSNPKEKTELIADGSSLFVNESPKMDDVMNTIERTNELHNRFDALCHTPNFREARLNKVADELTNDIVDSISTRITKRKKMTSKQKDKAVREDFMTTANWNTKNNNCLASTMAALKKALRGTGYERLEKYMPEGGVLISCNRFIKAPEAKNFLFEVKNSPEAIEKCIKDNYLCAGTLIFYPRGEGKYHATSLEKTEDGALWMNEGDTPKVQAFNNENRNAPLKTFCGKGGKTYLFNTREFLLECLKAEAKGLSNEDFARTFYHNDTKALIQDMREGSVRLAGNNSHKAKADTLYRPDIFRYKSNSRES